MSDINKEVGFNVRQIRENQKISQEKLAALAYLHRANIGYIESGKKNGPNIYIEKIK